MYVPDRHDDGEVHGKRRLVSEASWPRNPLRTDNTRQSNISFSRTCCHWTSTWCSLRVAFPLRRGRSPSGVRASPTLPAFSQCDSRDSPVSAGGAGVKTTVSRRWRVFVALPISVPVEPTGYIYIRVKKSKSRGYGYNFPRGIPE